jgi:hypothetical protein
MDLRDLCLAWISAHSVIKQKNGVRFTYNRLQKNVVRFTYKRLNRCVGAEVLHWALV